MLPSTPSSDNSSDNQESVWPTPPGKASEGDASDTRSDEQSDEQSGGWSDRTPKPKPAQHVVPEESYVESTPSPKPQNKPQSKPQLKLKDKAPNEQSVQRQTIQAPAIEPEATEKSTDPSAESETTKSQITEPQTVESQTTESQTTEPQIVEPQATGPWKETERTPQWREGEIIKVEITDLSNGGDGVGRWEDRVVFVPNTVPGDEMRVKLTKVKPTYGFGKPAGIVTPSPERVRPACIVADKCGGCQWQQVSYPAQLKAKQHLVTDTLARVGKLENIRIDPVLAAEEQLGYRNKATYPVRLSQTKAVKAGYYRKGSHRLVNLNQCPVQDDRLDPLLAEVKKDIQEREWKIYDERTHKGHIKHLSLRVGRRTGEILLTLVSRSVKLKGIHEQAKQWMERYPNVVGVLINLNWKKTNAIFGPETFSIAGEAHLEESFAGLTFHIQPATFFQVNTTQAEKLLSEIQAELALTGEETLVDAYCGVGTFTLPLAKQVKQCIGLEAFTESVVQAQANAALNDIENVDFKIGDVATLLPELETTPDIVMLDPPRKGCEPEVLAGLIAIKPARVVYVSCNPATLARDLRILCEEGGYTVTRVQPADFFPQTSHVECAVFLVA